jgi:deoxyribodipyrimidine photolyase
MTTGLYGFRQDRRLADNPALTAAVAEKDKESNGRCGGRPIASSRKPHRCLTYRQQVDMVGHRYERVELALVLRQRFAQVVQIGAEIAIVKEDVATLHDVPRDIRQVEARKAGHSRGK